MARPLCAILLVVFGLGASGAWAENMRPAGYIMAYELKGADAAKGTVVVRDGKELPPKLLMPLFDDDFVFIRDELSRITLEASRKKAISWSRASSCARRSQARCRTATPDSNVIKQIADILFGHGDDDLLSVLVAKGGDELKAPMAIRGRNKIVRSSGPLVVGWQGAGPFAVLIDQGLGGKAVCRPQGNSRSRLPRSKAADLRS